MKVGDDWRSEDDSVLEFKHRGEAVRESSSREGERASLLVATSVGVGGRRGPGRALDSEPVDDVPCVLGVTEDSGSEGSETDRRLEEEAREGECKSAESGEAVQRGVSGEREGSASAD